MIKGREPQDILDPARHLRSILICPERSSMSNEIGVQLPYRRRRITNSSMGLRTGVDVLSHPGPRGAPTGTAHTLFPGRQVASSNNCCVDPTLDWPRNAWASAADPAQPEDWWSPFCASAPRTGWRRQDPASVVPGQFRDPGRCERMNRFGRSRGLIPWIDEFKPQGNSTILRSDISAKGRNRSVYDPRGAHTNLRGVRNPAIRVFVCRRTAP